MMSVFGGLARSNCCRLRQGYLFAGSVVFFVAVMLAICGAAHGTPSDRPAVTIYQGQGVDTNLRELLPELATGTLDSEETYFTGLGYFHPLPTPHVMQRVFDLLWIPSTRTGLEATVVGHYGMQHNWEVDLAYTFRFAELSIRSLTLRFGVGVGLSYALSTPHYEDGPRDNPDKRYRFQNYEAYEIEWGIASFPRMGLVTRIHHRSGVYGLIAPSHVGSNFLTLGLRFSF
jgi:hypothetical protein